MDYETYLTQRGKQILANSQPPTTFTEDSAPVCPSDAGQRLAQQVNDLSAKFEKLEKLVELIVRQLLKEKRQSQADYAPAQVVTDTISRPNFEKLCADQKAAYDTRNPHSFERLGLYA